MDYTSNYTIVSEAQKNSKTISRLVSTETDCGVKLTKYSNGKNLYWTSPEIFASSNGCNSIKHASISTTLLNNNFFSSSTSTPTEYQLNNQGIKGLFRKSSMRVTLTNTNATTAVLIAPASLYSKIATAVSGNETLFQCTTDDRLNYIFSCITEIGEQNDRTQVCNEYGLNTSFSPNITIAQNAQVTFTIPLRTQLDNTYINLDKIDGPLNLRVYPPGFPITTNLNALNTDIQVVAMNLIVEYLEVSPYDYISQLNTKSLITFNGWITKTETFTYDANVAALQTYSLASNKNLVGPGLFFFYFQQSNPGAGARNTFSNNFSQLYLQDSNQNKFTTGPNVFWNARQLQKLACDSFNSSFFGDASSSNVFVINTCTNPKAVIKNNERYSATYLKYKENYQLCFQCATQQSVGTQYTLYLVGIYYSDIQLDGEGGIKEIAVAPDDGKVN